MNPEDEKLEDLSERIRKAEAKTEKSAPNAAGSRIGFDFAGSVLGSGIIGALADRAFGTSPWCLLGMVVFGFGIGIMNAWRSIQKPDGK